MITIGRISSKINALKSLLITRILFRMVAPKCEKNLSQLPSSLSQFYSFNSSVESSYGRAPDFFKSTPTSWISLP